MSKIYIVTSGSYSDYKIDAVYDNKELAEKHVELSNDCAIEEYEVNKFADRVKQGLRLFAIYMKKNGDVPTIITKNLEDDDRGEAVYFWKDYPDGILVKYVLAENEEHAIKITNEVRIQLIAADKWIEKETV